MCQHVHVAAAGLVQVFSAGRGGVGDRGGHRHADTEHLITSGHAASRAVADDDTRGAGAHQMQRRAVVEHPAGHDRHVEFGDEGLEVERLPVTGDPFGRDDRALDDQQIDARGHQHGRQRLGVLRANPHRRDHPGIADAGHRGAQ